MSHYIACLPQTPQWLGLSLSREVRCRPVRPGMTGSPGQGFFYTGQSLNIWNTPLPPRLSAWPKPLLFLQISARLPCLYEIYSVACYQVSRAPYINVNCRLSAPHFSSVFPSPFFSITPTSIWLAVYLFVVFLLCSRKAQVFCVRRMVPDTSWPWLGIGGGKRRDEVKIGK